jgi:hypothetical protein
LPVEDTWYRNSGQVRRARGRSLATDSCRRLEIERHLYVLDVRNKHVHVCQCARTSACRSAAAWSDCKREVQGRAGVVSAAACAGVYCRCVRVHGVLACKVVAARCVDRVSWLGVVCVARVLRGGGRHDPERGAEAAKNMVELVPRTKRTSHRGGELPGL